MCSISRSRTTAIPSWSPDYLTAHPALLKINGSVIETINPETHEFAICGEIAGDPFYIEILFGLGLRSISVTATEISEVKNIIRSISLAEAEKMAWQALKMRTGLLEIEDFLEKLWPAKNRVLREI